MLAEEGKAYTDMLTLFNDITQWNDMYTFTNASNILSATQQILINYNDQAKAYLADEDVNNRSLIAYLAGEDPADQWNMYKGLYQNYNIHIF